MRMYSSGDSEEDMIGVVNGETSDRKIIDHEKDRETLIHKGGKIQDHEIIVFERSPRVLRVSRRAFLFVKK